MSDRFIENEVIRRWQEGTPMRRIAAELRISRYLVKRIVLDHQRGRTEGAAHPDLPTPPESRGSILDGHVPFIQDLLTRWPCITALRVFEELRKAGFTGKYTIVKDLLRRLRPEARRTPVVRFESGKGQQAQMDYATYEIDFTEEGRRRVNLFSYVLGYSRRQYLHFVESQDFETTIREHVRAFQHLGGVAATCLYDNMKVVVARYEGDEPIYNTRFLAFATHYGYRAWACRRRRPQTKGKCERPFRYVEENFLNGRSFRNFEHLNECLAQWLAETADVRTHRETKRRPIDLHAEELPYLIPLPEKPYDTALVIYRTVKAEGMVAHRQNFYSVPWRYLGQVLPLRISAADLDAVLAEAEKQRWTPLELLSHLLGPQADLRRQRVIDRRIREARFREPVTLEGFDWQFNAQAIDRQQIETLATGEFIRRGENLVILGQSGVGKSHIVQAVGRAACARGYRVRYITSAELLQDLTASLADHTLPERLRHYSNFDLLAIDEFGFDRIERNESSQAASLLYKVVDGRTKRSTAMVTNISFEAWAEYLGDAPLAMAILDRVVDGAIILKIEGRSYRASRLKRPLPHKDGKAAKELPKPTP